MWKCYENVCVKWVCQIKNRGVVTGINTWTLLDTRNFRCEYRSIEHFGIESPITN